MYNPDAVSTLMNTDHHGHHFKFQKQFVRFCLIDQKQCKKNIKLAYLRHNQTSLCNCDKRFTVQFLKV